MYTILVILSFIFLGYVIGGQRETKHYQSLKEREKKLQHIVTVSFEKKLKETEKIQNAYLVTGSVVISVDYFKSILFLFYSLFGGEVKSFRTLMERGRREAILRMQEEAKSLGANKIVNVRLETSTISGNNVEQNKSIGSVEVMAYGTAIKTLS